MLPFKTRRTSQPQGAVEIDKRFGACSHWQSGGQSLLPSTNVPGNAKSDVVIATGGVGLSTSGGSLKATRLGSSDSVTSGDLTAVCQFRQDAAAGFNAGLFGNWSNTSATNFLQFVQADASLRLQCTRGGVGSFLDSSFISMGAINIAVAVLRGNTAYLYLNGVQLGSFSIGAGSLGTGQYWQVGTYYSNDSARISKTTVFSSSVFHRSFSDAEIKSISDNPWQLFKPVSRSLWLPGTVSGGGAATVIPIGQQATGSVGTLVATGAALSYPSGVSASSAVGTPVAVGGSSIPATVTPAGVSATGSVGAATATGQAKACPSGVSATASVGSPVALAGGAAVATPVGVKAVGAVGNLIATGAAWVVPGGVLASGAVGTPVASGGAAVAAVAYPVGLVGYWSVGTPTINTTGIETVSGAATRPSRIQVSNRAPRYQTGTRHAR